MHNFLGLAQYDEKWVEKVKTQLFTADAFLIMQGGKEKGTDTDCEEEGETQGSCTVRVTITKT